MNRTRNKKRLSMINLDGITQTTVYSGVKQRDKKRCYDNAGQIIDPSSSTETYSVPVAGDIIQPPENNAELPENAYDFGHAVSFDDLLHFVNDNEAMNQIRETGKRQESAKKRQASWKELNIPLLEELAKRENIPRSHRCVICGIEDLNNFWCPECNDHSYCHKHAYQCHTNSNAFHIWYQLNDQRKFYQPVLRDKRLESDSTCHICNLIPTEVRTKVALYTLKGIVNGIVVTMKCNCGFQNTTSTTVTKTLFNSGFMPGTPSISCQDTLVGYAGMAFSFDVMTVFRNLKAASVGFSDMAFVKFLRMMHNVDEMPWPQSFTTVYQNLREAGRIFRFVHSQNYHCSILYPNTMEAQRTICPCCYYKELPPKICTDGNLGLCGMKRVLSVSDPLWRDAFFVDPQPHPYLQNLEVDEGTPCNLRAAKEDANSARTKGLTVTGAFGSLCDHLIPFKFTNMTKGEGYHHYLTIMTSFKNSDYNRGHGVISGYDINCKIEPFLQKNATQFQEINEIYEMIKAFVIPLMHVYGHSGLCQCKYSPERTDLAGKCAYEIPETLWSFLKPLTSTTRNMRPENRVDALSEALEAFARSSLSEIIPKLTSQFAQAHQSEISTKSLLDEMKRKFPQITTESLAVWRDSRIALHEETQELRRGSLSKSLTLQERYVWKCEDLKSLLKLVEKYTNEHDDLAVDEFSDDDIESDGSDNEEEIPQKTTKQIKIAQKAHFRESARDRLTKTEAFIENLERNNKALQNMSRAEYNQHAAGFYTKKLDGEANIVRKHHIELTLTIQEMRFWGQNTARVAKLNQKISAIIKKIKRAVSVYNMIVQQGNTLVGDGYFRILETQVIQDRGSWFWTDIDLQLPTAEGLPWSTILEAIQYDDAIKRVQEENYHILDSIQSYIRYYETQNEILLGKERLFQSEDNMLLDAITLKVQKKNWKNLALVNGAKNAILFLEQM